MARMTDDELLSVLEAESAEAYQYNSGDVASSRSQALRDYLRFPYGNEQDGRSQVIASDVFDTVEGMLPDLVEVFVSSEKAVVFDPVDMGDEAGAKQATEACNYVFYKQNNGFLVLYTAAKDALLMRTGGVKWWWEVKRTPKFETRSGDEMQLAAWLASNPKTEVLSQEEAEEDDQVKQARELVEQHKTMPIEQVPPHVVMMAHQLPPKRYTVRTKTIEEKGKVCVQPIPPDELEICARHNSILLDDCPYVCHKSKKTLSEMQQMGLDVTVDDVKAAKDEALTQDREFYDNIRNATTGDGPELDESMVSGWLREEYILVDFDGDGIAERRRVLRLGKKILENGEFSHVPMAAWTPYILTHKFDGQSVWDLVNDFQKMSTDILRNNIDNLALANNQETVVLTDAQGNPKANIDDLLNRRVGGIIREQVEGAVRPYTERWQGVESMPMVQMLDQLKEKRTGYSPVVAGIDADALNKTATEVAKNSNDKQKRQKLMARIMAEAMVKPMFRGILKTLTDYCMEQIAFRLNGKFVQYDPQEWRDGYDMTVNVGIGSGDTMQQTQFLQGIASSQMAMLGSPYGQVLLDAEKIYNVHARLAENAGFKNPNEFWNAPKKDQQGNIVMPQAGPPLQLQIEQARQEGRNQSEQAKSQSDMQRHQAELQVQAANDARDAAREDARLRMEAQMHAMEQMAERQMQQQQLAFQQWREEMLAAVKVTIATIGAGTPQPVVSQVAGAEVVDDFNNEGAPR
jgi:hypothetical protein